MEKNKTAITLIGLILFMSLVAGCNSENGKKPENEVVPYVLSEIPEDLLTPVDIRQVATEGEKIKLEKEGYHCEQWVKRMVGGGYDPQQQLYWEPAVIFNDGWICKKEVEAHVGIGLLDKGGSFPEVIKGLSGLELEEAVVEYTIAIPQAGRLEWVYLLEGEHVSEADWYGSVAYAWYDSCEDCRGTYDQFVQAKADWENCTKEGSTAKVTL